MQEALLSLACLDVKELISSSHNKATRSSIDDVKEQKTTSNGLRSHLAEGIHMQLLNNAEHCS